MRDLFAELAAGKVAPVYYLAGPPYMLEQWAAAIRRAVLGQDDAQHASFNVETLRADEHRPEDVLARARTIPMFGGNHLVLVRQAHLYAAEALSSFLPYLKDPGRQTCLVLMGEKADTRLRFFKALETVGGLVRAEPLKERGVPGWLMAEAARQGITLQAGAAQRIADAVGCDMGELADALERLSLYSAGAPITVSAVEEALVQTRQRSIFELTNAVGQGDRRVALWVLGKMVAAREPGVRIIAMLARHLRQVWHAKELSAARQPKAAIAQAVGIHPYFLDDLLAQAARFDQARLARTHQALFAADWALKSSRLSDELVLNRLVLSLCP